MNKIDKWAVVLTAYFFLKSCWNRDTICWDNIKVIF